MIIPEHEIAITNRHGDTIYATLTLPVNRPSRVPLAVLLHGFKGFRNYSFLPWTAQYAAAEGAAVLRLCFSLNGMKNSSWMVQSTDDFARNTISRECDDAADTFAAIEGDAQFEALRSIWDGTISLIGHSRGGGIALLAASELQQIQPERVRKVAVWNSVGTWTRWTPRQADAWKQAGSFEMQNQRTLQMLTMNASYLEDIERSSDRLDLQVACSNLGSKLRLIHAQHDMTVPLREIEELASRAGAKQQLFVLQNTTHTFNMDHPVQRITKGFVDVLESTFPWLIAS
ncbi:MAG: alpha/beta hydrolase family protein [Ignavibacteria bacterium]